MKKLLLAFISVCFLAEIAFAGGLVTNTNQSASFIRNPARNASLNIDAAYFNPAGLVFLEDGIHISFSNQIINQRRIINSSFPGMNQSEFIGTVSAPIFPTFYGVYKQGRMAFSLGINPIGGGGSANFEDGLPSFEQMVVMENIPGQLTARGIPTTTHRVDMGFDGQSIFWGLQANASYAITDQLSASLGIRYVTAKNSYTGHLNIRINPNQPAFGAIYNGANLVSAPRFFTDASTILAGWNTGATSYVAGLQTIINAGLGTVLLSNTTVNGLTATQLAEIRGLITAAGQSHTGISIATARAILAAAAPTFAANSTAMAGFATLTSDKKVDAIQTGSGFAPIVSLNYKLSDRLHIAARYEHKIAITLTNETNIDDVGLYPDGEETPSDMPATLALGIAFKPLDRLTLSGGYHLYFDRSANYGKKLGGSFVDNKDVIDNNLWEAAFGVEYELTDQIMVSAGYLRTQTGVNIDYQSDFSHSLSTNSIGLGGRFMVNDNLGINLGFMNTFYEGYIKAFGILYNEEYNRKATVIAFGIDYKL